MKYETFPEAVIGLFIKFFSFNNPGKIKKLIFLNLKNAFMYFHIIILGPDK